MPHPYANLPLCPCFSLGAGLELTRACFGCTRVCLPAPVVDEPDADEDEESEEGDLKREIKAMEMMLSVLAKRSVSIALSIYIVL